MVHLFLGLHFLVNERSTKRSTCNEHLHMGPFIHAFQPSLAFYTIEEVLNHGWSVCVIFICSSGQNQTQHMIKQSSQLLKNMALIQLVYTLPKLYEKRWGMTWACKIKWCFYITSKTCNMDSWYQDECAEKVKDRNFANVVLSWGIFMQLWQA